MKHESFGDDNLITFVVMQSKCKKHDRPAKECYTGEYFLVGEINGMPWGMLAECVAYWFVPKKKIEDPNYHKTAGDLHG